MEINILNKWPICGALPTTISLPFEPRRYSDQAWRCLWSHYEVSLNRSRIGHCLHHSLTNLKRIKMSQSSIYQSSESNKWTKITVLPLNKNFRMLLSTLKSVSIAQAHSYSYSHKNRLAHSTDSPEPRSKINQWSVTGSLHFIRFQKPSIIFLCCRIRKKRAKRNNLITKNTRNLFTWEMTKTNGMCTGFRCKKYTFLN